MGLPGDLDRSFDGDGRRVIAGEGADRGNAVAIQPDGRIVVAGGGGPETALTVTRLNADGSLDSTLDGDGTRRVDLGGDETANAVAVQADGRIVLAGSTSIGANVLVARLRADGTPDPTFGPGGVRIIDYGGTDSAQAVAVQGDGKILLGGTGGRGAAMMLTRLLSDGTPDTGFDGDGTAGVNLSPQTDAVFGMARQRDGRVLVAGSTGSPSDGAVVRFTRDGAIDGQFGIAGTRVIDRGGADVIRAIALQADGRVVVAGRGGPRGSLVVSRLGADGTLDRRFGGDGSTGFPTRRGEIANGMGVQRDGRIVVVGTSGDSMLVARFLPGGAPDTSFSGDGRRLIDLGGADSLSAVALQPDGRIVAAGTTGAGGGDVAVVRLQSTGTASTPKPTPTRPTPTAVLCQGRRATIVGTAGRDVLVGTRGRDVVAGLGGNDLIRSVGGRDLVCGGAGADVIDGGTGRDRLFGGAASDTIRGGTGHDSLTGGAGRDVCSGGPGEDEYACEVITGR